MSKSCCVCGTSLIRVDQSYPRFRTDPENPELICKACLPGELVASFKQQAVSLGVSEKTLLDNMFTGVPSKDQVH